MKKTVTLALICVATPGIADQTTDFGTMLIGGSRVSSATGFLIGAEYGHSLSPIMSVGGYLSYQTDNSNVPLTVVGPRGTFFLFGDIWGPYVSLTLADAFQSGNGTFVYLPAAGFTAVVSRTLTIGAELSVTENLPATPINFLGVFRYWF